MRASLETYLSQSTNNNSIQKNFRSIGRILSLLVILSVFWGLKLTGITMAGEAFCGIEEHAHSEACMVKELICQQDEMEPHTHTKDCLLKNLICEVPEQKGHTHSEECMGKPLICTLEEIAPHSHGENCTQHLLTCPLPEETAHTHGESCYIREIGCGLAEAFEHRHSDSCYILEATCGQEESAEHPHDDSCYTRKLICGLEELVAHLHQDSCYILEAECGLEESEDHAHTDSCFTRKLGCGLKEFIPHQHTESCLVSKLQCELPESEGHTHGDDCYGDVLTCTIEETDGHTHGTECYAEEDSIICGKEEIAEHFHTDECYLIEEGTYICDKEETEGHSHTEECYEIRGTCSLEEHTHTPECYSDFTADLETDDDWEAALSELILTPNPEENLLLVSRSQLGIAESTRNFQVDDNGIRRGITRYGQWYGNPYGDWSAMFVSFCLEYAGLEEIPLSAGAETMRMKWEAEQVYLPAAEHTPDAGQLLFLDRNTDGSADTVAIITKLEENVIFAIEGNLHDPVTQIGSILLYEEPALPDTITEDATAELVSPAQDVSAEEEIPVDAVMETLYSLEDPAILGYGLLPMESGSSTLALGDRCSVWLDGTNGGIMSLNGSPNERWQTTEGATIILPTTWQSPSKYSYSLRGWYDVTNSKYYAPGEEITVTGNMVFYADWAASTYDIGQFNAQVVDTVSTNDFVTVRMFDYGVLFNVLSERANVTFSNNGHTETWNLLTSGNNPYNGQPTLNYIMRDWDAGNEDISYPNGTNAPNNPTDAGSVYPGLYTSTIRDLLFNPNTQVIGKQYLGTGDHLFQLCLDPSHEHYGYYYYNSERNAASYNQSAQRFYVYDYLECTRTSSTSGDSKGKMADFLPLNSPYANTNGKQVTPYTYEGIDGEHAGTTHYMYDCRYNDSGNSSSNVGTNFWFGMSVDVDFYLPNIPGTQVSGGYGNQDIYGKDMHFQFSGDDDVWILIDGIMVLDLGGIHGMESGDINFSTGTVTVNGVVNQQLSNNLKSIGAGEHTLSLYYLERGSSMSNCAIYFNLAPRFSFSIQKEDVLTRDVLNGAQFAVYTDQACTVPAQLWTSKLSHDRNDPSTNIFTVTDGIATMWGMGSGNTYYIKEITPPSNPNYEGLPNGVIRLSFDKLGTASYDVEIIDTGQGISGGFTVHGLRVDAETQQAYIVATNAPKWVKETTSIQVRKQWMDQVNHNADSITVYLTVTDPDGTVRRIREVQLGSANDWNYIWENLPKYWADGSLIQYGVEEAYIPGYYNKVELVDKYTTTTKVWQQTGKLENGKTYIFGTTNGYLSTTHAAEDTGFMWVDEETAKTSPLALWTATANGKTYRLTNGAGQILTLYYGNGNPTDFFAYTIQDNGNDRKQFLSYSASGNTIRLYVDAPNGSDYYIGSMNSSNKFTRPTNSREAIVFNPKTLVETTTTQETTAGWAYLISNSELEQETSLMVQKYWDYGNLEQSNLHEQAQVTVKLLADGKDTGRTVTLSLKNGWKDTFRGLPYKDGNGKVIFYSVEESWNNTDWIPSYGDIIATDGSPPNYSTTITNRYRWGLGGPALPSTGTAARMLYVLCGGSIMLSSLVYGILSRRKRERRMK